MTTKPAWTNSRMAREPSEAQRWGEEATVRQREILREMGLMLSMAKDLTQGEAAERINTAFAERRAREHSASLAGVV